MKKIFIILAAVGLVLASCSKNEETDFNSQSPDAIKFTSVTSRASVADMAALTSDPTGFKVYGTSGTSPSAWYTGVNGTINYRNSSGSWGWAGTAAQWPTTAAGYPMAFYAMHPASPTGVVVTVTAPATIEGAITIQSTAATQVDLLAAKATTGAKPFDGTLPLTFNHILSKVNFGIIAGNATDVYVQYTGIKELKNTATYDYVAGTWGALTSSSVSYDYYASITKPRAIFTPPTKDETTANPFYTSVPHDNHLMLMPQTSTAWNPANNPTPTSGESYIELIYRLSNAGEEIGYDNAEGYLADYPSYIDTPWPNGAYSGINTGATSYGQKPLFVRVGFPVTANWIPGKGYTYNICLGTAGSNNGYYMNNTYFDEDGNDTGIPIIGPDDTLVDPGDPVTDGTITFRVNVTNWDDLPATNLQN